MKRDEPSTIPGIGAARARWLRDAFGIRTVGDLARLSPEEVERGRVRGRPGQPSPKTIEGWVREARRRERSETGATSSSSALETPVRRRAQAVAWTPIASFVVEFQTRAGSSSAEDRRTSAHHLERDHNQTWEGVDCDSLCGWMLERVPAAEGGTRDRTEPLLGRSRGGRIVIDRPRIWLTARVVVAEGIERTSVVRIDQPWSVIFEWTFETTSPLPERGRWQLDVAFKPIGGGRRFRLPGTPARIPTEDAKIDGTYRHRIDVMTGLLDSSQVDPVYAVTASVAYRSSEHEVVAVAFADAGLLTFSGEPARFAGIGAD
jgi:hypothetical protein